MVNELYSELKSTFDDYNIPPDFFAPLQIVDYEEIGGNRHVNPDDAEFVITVGAAAGRRQNGAEASIEDLKRKVPNIVKYYKEKTLMSLRSKAIKKEAKK